MPTCTVASGRFTSENILIQYLPCGVAAAHIQHLRFNSTVAGGSFKLRINGVLTAAITFNATVATLVSNINTAITAAIGASQITATGTLVTDITLTSTPQKFWEILVEADALTGNTTTDPNVTTDVTTQGSTLYTLSAQISKFNYEVTDDTVDVTAISEKNATEIPVKQSMTFDISLYAADESWNWAVRSGKRGILYVYPQGKVPGNKYFAFWALFDKYSESYPDHEVVEKEMSGVRQGDMVVPFDSFVP